MSETALVKQILLALGNQPDFICWRNNTGKLADVNGRWVTYGLGVGSADIIGVLAPWGLFIAFEVKTATGKTRPEQLNWGGAVAKHGGWYFVVHSVEQSECRLKGVREWMRRDPPALSDARSL